MIGTWKAKDTPY